MIIRMLNDPGYWEIGNDNVGVQSINRCFTAEKYNISTPENMTENLWITSIESKGFPFIARLLVHTILDKNYFGVKIIYSSTVKYLLKNQQ